MNLEELEKSWDMLDEELDKKALVDEQEVAKLISSGKADAQRKLGRLSLVQLLSLCVGGGLLLLLILAWILVPDFMGARDGITKRLIILLAFLAASLIAGVLWHNDREEHFTWKRNDLFVAMHRELLDGTGPLTGCTASEAMMVVGLIDSAETAARERRWCLRAELEEKECI